MSIELSFVGGGDKKLISNLCKEIKKCDSNPFLSVRYDGFVEHENVPDLLSKFDVGIFASSCENQPITLFEYLGSGLSIISYSKDPNKEVLKSSAFYFDELDELSICECLHKAFVSNFEEFKTLNKMDNKIPNWKETADLTLDFITGRG